MLHFDPLSRNFGLTEPCRGGEWHQHTLCNTGPRYDNTASHVVNAASDLQQQPYRLHPRLRRH